MSNITKTRNITLIAVFTAIVAVLQFVGATIHFGTFSISLVLVPIVIGAALCGPYAGAWFGFVFSLIVLFTDSAAFMVINPLGTILTVLIKGTLAGYLAGLVYKKASEKSQHRYFSVGLAAVIAPIVNTGVFLIGCRLFFFETIKAWGAGAGFDNAYVYMLVGFVGINFLLELVINIVLSPVIVRLIDYGQKSLGRA
ncbi:MAG: ECF transporter S component [Erysipelotrichaceae bacterium]|nr:ECF transporter S component [Erysipelotrichaceae bacterium]